MFTDGPGNCKQIIMPSANGQVVSIR
ncbi:hypothetical protein FP2506_14859 [Fulvimarina pelagi HTCC2506]|uniref:Uncharacterized protein n=1 Tax=Fulvimarina pelagi HTCC2506 TaxID=314231 RepID=Q0G3V8_9HYPH|nr:hypothetical protein FP2506_14859 [Fulvimarina pelagi HTCC2506]